MIGAPGGTPPGTSGSKGSVPASREASSRRVTATEQNVASDVGSAGGCSTAPGASQNTASSGAVRAPRATRSRGMRRGGARDAVAAMPQIIDFLPDERRSIGYLRRMRVIVIVYDGVQTLDAVGPAEVFATADRRRRPQGPPYEVMFASVGGGDRTTASSLVIRTRDLRRVVPRATDIALVAGADEVQVRAAAADAALLRWLRRAAQVVRRIDRKSV